MTIIDVKSIKVTIPIQATEIPMELVPPDGKPAGVVNITFQCGDIAMAASFNGKSFKKQMKKVEPGAFAVIQGKLGPGNQLLECGLVIQPPKPTA